MWQPNNKETYIGQTSTTFKQRWNFFKSQTKHRDLPSTALSNYIWKLKDNHYNNYNISWKILAKANPYSTATKICNLCNREKYYLMFRKDTYTLNEQHEVLRKCRHRKAHIIGTANSKLKN